MLLLHFCEDLAYSNRPGGIALMSSREPARSQFPGRRNFLALTGAGAAGSFAALAGRPAFAATAAEPTQPTTDPQVDDSTAVRRWYPAPADPGHRWIREAE
jgi:hypothetical protein